MLTHRPGVMLSGLSPRSVSREPPQPCALAARSFGPQDTQAARSESV